MKPLYWAIIILVFSICLMIYRTYKEAFTGFDALEAALEDNKIDNTFTEKVFGIILKDIVSKYKKTGRTQVDVSNNVNVLNNFMTDAAGIFQTTNKHEKAYKLLLGRMYGDINDPSGTVLAIKRNTLSNLYKLKFQTNISGAPIVDISNSVSYGISAEAVIMQSFGVEDDAANLAYFTPSTNRVVICKPQAYFNSKNQFINRYVTYIDISGIRNRIQNMSRCETVGDSPLENPLDEDVADALNSYYMGAGSRSNYNINAAPKTKTSKTQTSQSSTSYTYNPPSQNTSSSTGSDANSDSDDDTGSGSNTESSSTSSNNVDNIGLAYDSGFNAGYMKGAAALKRATNSVNARSIIEKTLKQFKSRK